MNRATKRWRRWVDVTTMALEVMRYGAHELLAGRWGSTGPLAYQFLADGLLVQRYQGRRKEVVTSFVLYTALRCEDASAVRIALAQPEAFYAIARFRNVEVLRKLQSFCTTARRDDCAALAARRLLELDARRSPSARV